MKNLIIKYNRKDFFGNRIYTEDTKSNFTKADLAKAFLFISISSGLIPRSLLRNKL